MNGSVIDSLWKNSCWCCEIPDLHEFMFEAKPGERFTYFIGFTLTETLISKQLRKLVYSYAVKGLVYIFQPRFKMDPTLFEFICIKASSPPVLSLLPYSEEKLSQERSSYVKVEGTDQVNQDQLSSI